MSLDLSFKILTPNQWEDFVELFGERGACGGCWCMLWRLSRKQYGQQKGNGNKSAMKALVDSGEVPGILAYFGTKAVGWCAIAPRERYPAFAWTGIPKSFERAGFTEAARRSATRPIMRIELV